MTTTQRRPATAPRTDHPKWFEGNFGVFDCETTGIDPLTARMVSYASLYVNRKGEVQRQSKWGLINPGIPIPEEASKIHGITDEMAGKGISHDSAVRAMVGDLSYLRAAKEPLVIFNAPYDLTILFVQARALGVELPEVMVLDPLVIDRSLDRYRKGSRRLEPMCQHYGVTLEEAHDARGDAVATAALILKMSQQYPELSWRVDLIHKSQVNSQKRWAEDYERHRREKDPECRIDRGWPIKDEALGVERTEQAAMFDLPEKPKREAKRYDVPSWAKFEPCKTCGRPIFKLHIRTTDEGKKIFMPVTESGHSHYLDCPDAKQHSRGAKA